MPPWEAFQPGTAQSTPALAGPWQKFRPPTASPVEQWQDPGMIVPLQFPKNGDTNGGWPRFAMPQALTEVGNAMSSVTKAATGQYGIEIDPATGRPTTITNGMIGDAMSGASLGLTTLSPAAAVGAKFGQQALSGPARRIMQRTLANDQIPLSEVGPRLAALGPDAVVADLGPGLQARAAAIATMPGSGQKSIVDALAARRAGANLRITGDVDAALGPAPVPSYLQADITANKRALSPYYRNVLSGPDVKAVDTAPLAESLDAMVINDRGATQSVANTVRKMLNLSGESDVLDPSPDTLLATRQAVGGMLSKAESAIDKDPTQIGALKHIYGQIDELLTGAVPGIKDVDAQYQELARQSAAVGDGQGLLESGRTAPRPVEVEDMFDGVGPDGKPLVRNSIVGPSAVPLRLSQGARAEIERIIGTNINDVTAMKRIVAGEGNWNRERLATAFGQEKADRLLNILEREAKYAATDQLALQGSRTQVLKAAQEDIVGKGPRANPVRSAANFRFGDAAADLADRTLGWIGEGKRSSTNAKIAEALMAQGGSGLAKSLAVRQQVNLPSWPAVARALAFQLDQERNASPTVPPGPRR